MNIEMIDRAGTQTLYSTRPTANFFEIHSGEISKIQAVI